ncbi:hypothetical protein SSS_07571 [Sarcoptes scabiei]|uniref:Uncharacterized protein n=1 Tax=Sarcoptes scabiei TaxID=52283 RepID=A0A834R1K6_SARSC|nr:hypothetical protein SSS_07571 [Sarcoptes scabiei]
MKFSQSFQSVFRSIDGGAKKMALKRYCSSRVINHRSIIATLIVIVVILDDLIPIDCFTMIGSDREDQRKSFEETLVDRIDSMRNSTNQINTFYRLSDQDYHHLQRSNLIDAFQNQTFNLLVLTLKDGGEIIQNSDQKNSRIDHNFRINSNPSIEIQNESNEMLASSYAQRWFCVGLIFLLLMIFTLTLMYSWSFRLYRRASLQTKTANNQKDIYTISI